MPLQHLYLFLLGVAGGIALLPLTAYRRVSPRWLRWLLRAFSVSLIGCYGSTAAFEATQWKTVTEWALRSIWLVHTLGFLLPSVFAVDQLVRHPAMSPRRLLLWSTPVIIACGLIVMMPRWHQSRIIDAGISIGFIGLCGLILRKFPSFPGRKALLTLTAGQALVGFMPSLYADIAMLFALWYAYDTAAHQSA